MAEFRLVYVTAPSSDEAWAIGRAMVFRRLAACANVLPGVRSCYWWQGEVCESDEVLLLLKTTVALANELTDAIKELHSYECPCIVALPIEPGNALFFDWIAESVRAQIGEG